MRRWRSDRGNPVTLSASEREVQDILWQILRSVFDDVVHEETLPKLATAPTGPTSAFLASACSSGSSTHAVTATSRRSRRR